MKVLFIVNNPKFLISHRLPILDRLKELGNDVHVAAPEHESGLKELETLGYTTHEIPLERSGKNIFKELKLVIHLYELVKEGKFDVLHLVTIKPVIYGCVVGALSKVKHVVAAISGLGHVFISTSSTSRVLRFFVKLAYKFVFGISAAKIIVQNKDDYELLVDQKICIPERLLLIKGSGVDLNSLKPKPEPKSEKFRVLLPARVIKEKGVFEFIDAARQIQSRRRDIELIVAGEIDDGAASSVSEKEILRLADTGLITWWGFCDDMDETFKKVHLVCLPSYREGMPKVLLEAAACGKPVITTDVPGCRDAIIPNETGLLVPLQEVEPIVSAILELKENPMKRRQMAKRARDLAVAEYSIESVVENTLKIYPNQGHTQAEIQEVTKRSA